MVSTNMWRSSLVKVGQINLYIVFSHGPNSNPGPVTVPPANLGPSDVRFTLIPSRLPDTLTLLNDRSNLGIPAVCPNLDSEAAIDQIYPTAWQCVHLRKQLKNEIFFSILPATDTSSCDFGTNWNGDAVLPAR